MPEGDTIYRAAATMRRWLQGRTITRASTTSTAPVERLVGETVDEVEARAKHLLIRCSGNLTIHTHMKMTGSWHVYSAGQRWRRPRSQARLVLETDGDPAHVAVCFNAPVVELIERRAENLHPALASLGPDVLEPPVDVVEVRRRATELLTATVPVADLLIDQRVVSGIGNIWRCESLFVERLDPATPWVEVAPLKLDALVLTASTLMVASAGAPSASAARGRHFVYRRARRPCRRCSAPIRAARFANNRTVYWCPNCQVRPSA